MKNTLNWKNEDNLKNEDDLINEDKNEDDLKMNLQINFM